VVRFLGFRLTCSHAPVCVPKSVPDDIILDILIRVHSHLMFKSVLNENLGGIPGGME